MKKLMYLSMFLVLLFSISCKKELKENAKNDGTIMESPIKVTTKQTVTELNSRVKVQLDSVLNDSRCPMNANCIWAGNAAVRLKISVNNNETSITLNTTLAPLDSVVNGYKITLNSLSPYPYAGIEIKQEEYKADISVSKE